MSIDTRGYYCFTTGPHKGRRVHRVVMENHLGRELNRDEIVHHKDNNKLNNDVGNLEILGEREHNAISAKQAWHFRNQRKKELAEWNDYFDTPTRRDDSSEYAENPEYQ